MMYSKAITSKNRSIKVAKPVKIGPAWKNVAFSSCGKLFKQGYVDTGGHEKQSRFQYCDDSNTPKDEVQEISTNDYFHTEDIWNTDILLLTNGNQHKPGIIPNGVY